MSRAIIQKKLQAIVKRTNFQWNFIKQMTVKKGAAQLIKEKQDVYFGKVAYMTRLNNQKYSVNVLGQRSLGRVSTELAKTIFNEKPKKNPIFKRLGIKIVEMSTIFAPLKHI